MTLRNAAAVVKIITLNPGTDGDHKVTAQYNPKEVQIEQSVGWEDHEAKDGGLGLEFTHKKARTFSLELLFDGAEGQRSVRPQLDDLQTLIENVGTGKLARPPVLAVIWGASSEESLPRFPVVIDSLSTKFQMFSHDGKVVRATATVKFKEAGTVGIKPKAKR